MTATLLSTSATGSTAPRPSITIIVAPREGFSSTKQSLESIYKYTQVPFNLVYVDAGSPRHIQKYLQRTATKRGFTLLRTEHYLSPNQARNLGLSQVTTDYVVFVDNDIHVSAGWLEKLWQCAQETDAAVVCPITCIGKPLHDRIYFAGGEVRIFMDAKGSQIRRRLYENRFLVNRSVASIKHQLYRRSCELTELRCALIRRTVFNHIGCLDEQLLGTQEDIDFCLRINRLGGRIYCEPAARVTHVPRIPGRSDLAYFMLRWSDAWEVESLMHFQQKWDLDMDDYFLQRYRQLGYYRRQALLYPLLHCLVGERPMSWLKNLALGLERWLNQQIVDRHARLQDMTVTKFVPTLKTASNRGARSALFCSVSRKPSQSGLMTH